MRPRPPAWCARTAAAEPQRAPPSTRPMRPPCAQHLRGAPGGRGDLEPALLLQRRGRRGGPRGRRALLRSDRGCRGHARGERHRARRQQAFVPQCGLAPGLHQHRRRPSSSRHFDELRAVKLRVGALPQHPQQRPQVLAHLVHRGPHQRIRQSLPGDRRRPLVEVAPLEGLEEIEIDGTLYEAFNTSGGLGSLAETYGAAARR